MLDTGAQYSVHGEDSIAADLDFSDTFGVVGNGPIFNALPDGVSVVSPNFQIGGNALLQPVPLPGAAWFLVAAVAALGRVGRRRR